MKLCKICDLIDWENEDFQAALAELNMPATREHIHRKYWEFAMGIQAFKAFNKLHENAIALGIGSGTEPVMYYLANHIKHVYATDIYGVGSFAEGEAQAEMLTNPAKHAPFPYREDHLTVEFMDGRYLLYDSNMFDIVFSFSSIEHFGSRDDIKQAMKEIGRVLKPGGIAVIATEVILNDQAHPEFFKRDELLPCLAEPGSLELAESELDYTISAHLLQRPLQWFEREGVFPHIALQIGKVIFTSVFLALRKPERTTDNDSRKVDKNLRLELSRLKFTQPQIPAVALQIQEIQSGLAKIPVVAALYQTLRRKFHELVIFYLLQVSNQLQQLAQYQARYLYLAEQLLLKSELYVTRSDFQALEAKIEALERQLETLQHPNSVLDKK